MRLLIVGLGSAGRRHLRNLAALGQQDIVLLRSGKSTLPEAELDGYPAVHDLEAALQAGAQAAVIATPTALHLEAAIPLARAGCHLLLEKPVSHTLAGVDELSKAARQGGARIMVAFQYRYHPGLQAVEHWVRSGAIGRPYHARAHYGDFLPAWHPWEDYRASYSARPELGGGVVLTLCHPLDYLLWLMGAVRRVAASVGSRGDLGIPVEDTADALLELEGGASGSVHLDYLQRPPEHRLEILGTAGTIRWDQADGAARLDRAAGGAQEIIEAPQGYERNHMFLAEMQRFLAVVEAGESPWPNLEDGIRALALGAAILESSRRGTRVELNP
jgi:predicted dehydrogenase